jgi:hypothetical protein
LYSINEEVLSQCRQLLTEVCLCGCSESGKPGGEEINWASLEALKKYEKDLEHKLKAVRERIISMETKYAK